MSTTINFAIDLGTTNSLIAKAGNGGVDIFKNPAGMKLTLPSVVAFRKDRILIGDKAREYIEKDPANVFACFKRKMGTSESFFIPNSGEFKTPIELSAIILRELRNFIFTGESPKSVVITIPASFDTIQSNATKEAGYAAGFKEVLLLQEPIAASLAFANKEGKAREGKSGLAGQWLVYDLGGGTFDVALVTIDEDEMKVVDHEGDNFLGGLDFDQLMIKQLFIPYLEEKFGISDLETKMLRANGSYNRLYYQLLYKAEDAKIALSSYPTAEIEFDFTDEAGERQEVFFTIDRGQFDECVREKIAYSISFIRKLLERNRLSPSAITEVVLVGGSTYIPLVRAMLAEELRIGVNTSIDPTTAVVEGAAWYAGSRVSRLEAGPKGQWTSFPPGTADKDVRKDDVRGAGGDGSGAGTGGTGSKGADGAAGGREGSRRGEGDAGGAANVIEVKTAYQVNTRENEEYFAAAIKNFPPGCFYRIIRSDGGFDSGLKPVAARISEMLALMPNALNIFQLKLYDATHQPMDLEIPEICITQGRFSVYGQPLPNDICLEVDDAENRVTHLEVIFERNTILPIRKSITKSLSRTIVKGSDDQLLINVLEGSRYASPPSNLPIGVVSITGKELTTDLVKGCDIDLTFEISESRDITVTAYISMIDAEFSSVFSPSSRTVNLTRLQEETDYLHRVGQRQLRQLLAKEQYEVSAVVQEAMIGLEEIRDELKKINADDVTDARYQLDDRKRRLAQVIDSAEKGERLVLLKEEYYAKKEDYYEMLVQSGDQELLKRFEALGAEEGEWMSHCSPGFLRMKIKEMDRLTWNVRKKSLPYVTSLYMYYAMKPDNAYSNINEIRLLKKRGDEALTRGIVDEILAIIYRMYELLIDKNRDETMVGTGLRG